MGRRSESSAAAHDALLERLQSAALDTTYVSLGSRRTASPHEFYRYPARFPPAFARAVIEAFTKPGDLVLDPFLGGGTTLVESRLLSRLGIGSDLNPLAVFVSKVKTRPHFKSDLDAVSRWLDRLPRMLESDPLPSDVDWESAGYFRNIDTPELAELRHGLARARRSLITIYPPAAETFARCVLLRAGQWALDMASEAPTLSAFQDKLIAMGHGMIEVGTTYRRQVRVADQQFDAEGLQHTTIVRQGLPGLADRIGESLPAPRLILTSPPYPGVYVNYHRWKVLGRRETPAPFWLADRRDGKGQSYYTMGARADRSLDTYFSRLEAAFVDLARLANRQTLMVQMVGFHNPDKDLPRYLQTMRRAGFSEVSIPSLATRDDRLWRTVPNRRWWVQDGTKGIHTSDEVVLFHKLSD